LETQVAREAGIATIRPRRRRHEQTPVRGAEAGVFLDRREAHASIEEAAIALSRQLLQSLCGVVMTGRIEINPSVMQGKPVVRNTRIPVELLLRKLAEGATVEELLDAYPRLTEADIQACLAYAADTIAHESIYSVASE
jgi:uncharacterized protein (DUF433 family)